ncbi:glycosyltransferase family 2 protein [Vibrio parahaemolyticus]|uniref:glycosyltransferase family 2 protein n=1 Tax=Vibrio parahaemolyticus TaxID=670 RepID=UPI0004700920|nr:glycosyltransferase family 2 protein [Vibrio parahaemolyticus]MCI4893116.1 glycosyltransferase [Vibrio parahaemolyticus]MDF4958996.1 glycosyltransferase family 2 protein [Vibrio parahaemolyticus]MDF5175828.1 glycosyltransferase family 2 protein [Vibrio parahaemolyticus]MDF5297409.1 glycosyltransferase family 2 protein [Vibrio parahaemolyticus]MDF5433312.1 glycosyltransferase family 2 protein [Vibrio parahaemolyticus]
MKVSIVTALYNSEPWIRETYLSIKSQSFKNWEWLVTDDCSTDNSVAVIEEIMSSDSRVKLFKNKVNSGAAVSRNNSIAHATGDFIAFLDSDDLWSNTKLEKQLFYMGDEIDFCFTAYELIDGTGQSLNKTVDSSNSGSFSYSDMLKKKATLGCSTVILRNNVFKDISMPLLRTGQDYALWLKLLKQNQRAYLLNEVLSQYRILPNSISRNKIKKSKRQWEIYRDIEKLNLFYSSICFLSYAFRAIFRKQ